MSELRKILIIDDEEFIRESLGDHFEDRGWVVCTAESGEAALVLMETMHPDACLVDVRMGFAFWLGGTYYSPDSTCLLRVLLCGRKFTGIGKDT